MTEAVELIPDPRIEPTMKLERAGRALGLGRSTSYELARSGEFPVPVIRVRNIYRVPTMGVLRALDLAPVAVGA